MRTPTAERLAEDGLSFNRFHTTAMCAPTRAALLTGRNHHTVGMGSVPDLATAAPGYSSVRPDDCAPLAQTLRLNGYTTAQFGKCHEVAAEYPEKLEELKRLFLIEAVKYGVLPLDDRRVERFGIRTSPVVPRSSAARASCCSPVWDASPRVRCST